MFKEVLFIFFLINWLNYQFLKLLYLKGKYKKQQSLGGTKFVHNKCLLKWISDLKSDEPRCSVCRYKLVVIVSQNLYLSLFNNIFKLTFKVLIFYCI